MDANDRTSADTTLARGVAMLHQVYGADAATAIAKTADQPLVSETIRHLFGEIWSRPSLSVRDRRLLVIGATAMLGRADLMEIQIVGGLRNSEFDDAELDEMMLHLAFYAGWGNITAASSGVAAAKKRVEAERKDS